ncbi:MAG: AMP-binding protein [Pseudomonadota bacterium]
MTIDRWISGRATTKPDHPAIVFQGETWSYADFEDRIGETAAALAASGVGSGDRVAWYGLNRPEVFSLMFAAARIGAILCPLNWRLAAAEIAAIVDDCGPKLVVHDDHFAHPAQALAGRGRKVVHHAAVPTLSRDQWAGAGEGGGAEAPLLIVYTSGSTGGPKGAVLSQAAVEASAVMSAEAHEMTGEDVALACLPFFHVGGLNIIPGPVFLKGATLEIHERFDPAEALAAIQRIDAAVVVPTVLQAIMAAPGWAAADLSRLRLLSIGSTDVPVELIEAAHARGVPLIQLYGATETSPLAIHQRRAEAMETVGSIGAPGSLASIRLMREDGTEALVGEPGEIWVKGPSILSEYWRNPAETERSILDGWFRTGDVARRDGDGRYWFMDRIKHVVISGGENIYPAELERILRPHPKVREVSVVGRPDPQWGEIPVAVIAATGEMTEAEVLSAFNGALARYKHPKAVAFVDALPRNAMGKVVASDVRAMIGAD